MSRDDDQVVPPPRGNRRQRRIGGGEALQCDPRVVDEGDQFVVLDLGTAPLPDRVWPARFPGPAHMVRQRQRRRDREREPLAEERPVHRDGRPRQRPQATERHDEQRRVVGQPLERFPWQQIREPAHRITPRHAGTARPAPMR